MISRELLSDAKRLDRFYIISRYPDGLTYGTPHDHFTSEDAHAAIRSAGDIIRFCQDILA
jgi:HEPN domain-containing protein